MNKKYLSKANAIALIMIMLVIDFIYYINSNDFQTFLGGICIIVAIYIFSLYNKKDFLHPISIYSIFWLGVAGISTFRVSYYQTKWSTYMWIVVILAYITFVIGFKLFRNEREVKAINAKIDVEDINISKLYFILKILTYLMCIALLIEVVVLKYIPLFSKNMGAYMAFNITGVHYFVILAGILPALAVLYKKIGGDKHIWWIILLSFAVSILILSRQLIIMQIVILVIEYHYLYRKIQLKKFIILFCIGAIIFSFSFSLRKQNTSYINKVAGILPKYQNSMMIKTLLYFNMNFNNLNFIVNNFHDYKMGENMIFPIVAFANLKNEIDYNYKSQYLVTQNFNTSTYLSDIYFDFGIVGVLIIPFLLGVIYSRLYSKMNKKISINNIIYILLLYCLIFCFFVNWYYNTAIVFDIVVLILINLYTKNKALSK